MIKVTVDIKKPKEITRRIITPTKSLEIVKLMERMFAPYVPRDTGNLMDNTDVDKDGITYNAPYAEVNYKGTDRNFSKEKNPLATAYWDKACMKAKGDKVEAEIERILQK